MRYLSPGFFGIKDAPKFYSGINSTLAALVTDNGTFTGDNLITFSKNLSFMSDSAFMAAFSRHATTPIEKAIIWRMATVLWGARNGLRLEGDFVECACYKGITARIICDTIGFASRTDKRYYLYDLFEHDEQMPHHDMPEHSTTLYDEVKQRFADISNVTITQGRVPDSLHVAAPEKIAFLHLDLNNAEAEIGALEMLFDRMVPGAVMVLDDYGWLYYREQKIAEDSWMAKRGYHILELPTGQGLLVK